MRWKELKKNVKEWVRLALENCFSFERFGVYGFVKNKHHEWYCLPIDWIRRDLKKNQNVILVFLGRQGSGKSYLSFLMAWLFNKYWFGLEPALTTDDIYWSVKDFTKAMLTTKDKFIILEETSLSLGAKDFWTDSSRIFNKIIDIFRISNVSLCLNLPYIFDLDKGTRLKANYLFRTHKMGKNKVWCSFHKKGMSEDTSKAWYQDLGWFEVPLIPKGEFDYKKYEELKREYNKEKYSEFHNTLTKDSKNKVKRKGIKKPY